MENKEQKYEKFRRNENISNLETLKIRL